MLQVQAHLTRPPRSASARRASRRWRPGLLASLSAVALGSVGLSCILAAHTTERREGLTSMTAEERSLVKAVLGEQALGIAYPLPDKPIEDQAKAPCYPNRGQVEINGGCWVTLEKRAPCYDDQAEYQGKCYMPVSAKSQKPLPPQAVHDGPDHHE